MEDKNNSVVPEDKVKRDHYKWFVGRESQFNAVQKITCSIADLPYVGQQEAKPAKNSNSHGRGGHRLHAYGVQKRGVLQACGMNWSKNLQLENLQILINLDLIHQ